MLILITSKITKEQLIQAATELQGYVKFVVDIEKGILTAGGIRHVMGEQLLIENGSLQENLWGGGLDLETNELDYDSMINIRPNQNNPSREVLFEEIRNKIDDVVNKLLR